MGSVQQISIGVVCLVAAFAFGNYVNTHPSGDHPNDAAQAELDTAASIGNVHSRLNSGIEFIQKQPASIPTLRNRLQPRFAIPSTDPAPEFGSPSGTNSLPPPSQLAGKQPVNSPEPGSPTAATSLEDPATSDLSSRTPKASDVPDFTSIMNELDGSPIALQPLKKLANDSGPIDNRSLPSTAKARGRNAKPSLKDLASEFTSTGLTPENDVANPWNTPFQPEFTADDFAPRLKAGRSGESSLPGDRSIVAKSEIAAVAETRSHALANPDGLRQGLANHVVSRAAIPPESVLGQPERSVLRADPNLAPATDTFTTAVAVARQDEGRQPLSAIKSRTGSQLELKATRFVDHVVQPGETLQSIAKRYFGDPDYYLDIYLANRNKLRNPASVEAGTALRIPIYQ